MCMYRMMCVSEAALVAGLATGVSYMLCPVDVTVNHQHEHVRICRQQKEATSTATEGKRKTCSLTSEVVL